MNQMKNSAQKLFSLLALLVIMAAGAYAQDYPTSLTIETSDGTTHTFEVELALTPAEQAQGLMFRTELADNAGMLFVFPEPRRASFWMRNTLIPLDMLFVRENGRIANILEMVPMENDLPRRSIGKVRAVLELAGGRSEALGIKAGDLVRHPAFQN